MDAVMVVEAKPLRAVAYVITSTRARYVDPATGAPLGPYSRTEDIRLSATFERPDVGARCNLSTSRRHRRDWRVVPSQMPFRPVQPGRPATVPAADPCPR